MQTKGKSGLSPKSKTVKRGRPPNKVKKPSPNAKKSDERVKSEIYAIVLIALGIFFAIAMMLKSAGAVGLWVQYLLKGTFGAVAYILPYYLIIYGILLFIKKVAQISIRSVIFFFAILISMTIINSARYLASIEEGAFDTEFMQNAFLDGIELASGGFIGMTAGYGLEKLVGAPGLYLLCISIIVISVLLLTNTPMSKHFETYMSKRNEKKELKALKKSEYAQMHDEDEEDEEQYIDYKNDIKSDLGKEALSEIKDISGKRQKQSQIMEYMADDELFKEDYTSEEHLKDVEEKFRQELEKKPDTLDVFTPVEELVPVTDVTDIFDLPSDSPINENGILEKEENIGEEREKNEKTDNTALIIENATLNVAKYKLPSTDLLKLPLSSKSERNNDGDLAKKAALLEKTLKDFGVDAKILNVSRGPAVTRYEIQPSTGVKVSSIVRLADDIALNLEARSIRLEAPIPGKAAVGIEVENEKVQAVVIREVIDSREFKENTSKISFCVGKNVSGKTIIADLKQMPHLLIAGSTGSGKSVCVNNIITSILYKARPDEVKLILIDTKVVELTNYNGIPHLLCPVVTDPGKAAATLHWAVQEMDGRYIKFADNGVRELASYNSKMKTKGENPLPQIVIIIDELADLMMTASSQVETLICRIAQKARAAGMHLIVATQRPSVDVITGLIKANIASRIAFSVSSQIDSRTIIDMAGAEKLVGNGDMLFNPMGVPKPMRVQGAFISDSEVEKVINFVKSQGNEGTHEFEEELIKRMDVAKSDGLSEQDDEYLNEAIETVISAEQASVSMLQRRFRVGYNRAARIIDIMEERGIVGPADGSRPRRVLITKEEFDRMRDEGEN